MSLSNLSQEEFNFISDADMESSDVVEHFKSDLKIRTFADVLRRFSTGKSVIKDAEIKELLKAKFCEYDSAIKPDSIRKNIDNWFNGKEPNDKRTLIRLCFALSLGEHDARHFMKFTQESDFHLRDPEDAAFLYCLRVGKSYKEAEEFVKRFPMPPPADDEQDDHIVYTNVVAKALNDVSSDEDFEQFYRENLKNFGKLRNTAYDKIQRFWDELEKPGGSEAEATYSTEEIVNTYLRMKLPADKETAKLDAIQKTVRAYWPNRTDVIDIINRVKYSDRKIRKLLLLLYVVTEGFVKLNLENDVFDSDDPFEGHFMEHVVRVNLMLDQCGMARLEPRNPFDWLILHCLKTGGDEGMTKKLEDVLMILFSDTETGNRFDDK